MTVTRSAGAPITAISPYSILDLPFQNASLLHPDRAELDRATGIGDVKVIVASPGCLKTTGRTGHSDRIIVGRLSQRFMTVSLCHVSQAATFALLRVQYCSTGHVGIGQDYKILPFGRVAAGYTTHIEVALGNRLS